MARRKARRSTKLQPAVKTLSLAAAGGSSHTLDISQCASLLNRRFYRQGLNWAVAGFTFITAPSTSGLIGVQKIPDTWVSTNAWHKGFATWQKMNNEALEEAESVKPKFLDFKVFMDEIHAASGVGSNLTPYMGSPSTALTVGTWDMSEMIIPNIASSAVPGAVTELEILWTGGNYPGNGASGKNSVSLIEGYAASRGLP
jgi:hypothetical protein